MAGRLPLSPDQPHTRYIAMGDTVTPAMASNLTTSLKSWDEILSLVDMAEQKAIVARRWEKAKVILASA